jgi:formyltetrahydrofolate-dependent phosphoribosylglycinamide formyltransferase
MELSTFRTKTLDRPIRIAVLISGSGTTLQNLNDRIAQGNLNAEIVLVVASQSGCSGIERARQAELRCEVVERNEFRSVVDFSSAVFEHCQNAKADLVCLGGFLSLIQIPNSYSYRVLNIHPSLIPAFCGRGYYGQKVHEAVLDRGVKVSGCTVHFADNEYDHGPIIVQRSIAVAEDDTPQTLARRVFLAECEAYPNAISLFAAGRLEVIDRRVKILE